MKVDFSLGGLANSSLTRSRKSQLQSMSNMAAGYRRDLSRTDSGAYSHSKREESEMRFEAGLSSTLQNAMSIAHTQSSTLGEMEKILTKMSEIASLAGSTAQNSSEREIYQAQFDGLIKDFNNYSNTKLTEIGQQVNNWHLIPAGTEGYKTAEVTLGGIHTDGLSSKTMESKTQSGLYFVGEVVDVTGHLGGFNFQWAWSSGFACGEAI